MTDFQETPSSSAPASESSSAPASEAASSATDQARQLAAVQVGMKLSALVGTEGAGKKTSKTDIQKNDTQKNSTQKNSAQKNSTIGNIMSRGGVVKLYEEIAQDREQIFSQLSQLVAFDSVLGHEGNPKAAAWVTDTLRRQGFEVEQIPTPDGSDAVIGTLTVSAQAPTVLLYCHYDVVDAGDPKQWISPAFELTERGGRWYGRGAADCKGNVVTHLAALRAVAAAGGPAVNIRVVVEGSEEQGGAGLDSLLETRSELFTADIIFIADCGNVAVGVPSLTTHLRGAAQLTVTVNSLKEKVHSGMCGGAAPDAAAALIRILDTLKDEYGRTVIDGVQTDQVWEGQPYSSEDFVKDSTMLPGTQITAGPEDKVADLVWARPAITVTGLTTTPVDQATNAIAPTAQARLNLRVPAGMSAQATAEKLVEHLRDRAPWGVQVDVTIDDAADGFATDVSAPAPQAFAAALCAAYGVEEPAVVGTGGSIPLTLGLQKILPDADIVLFGVEDSQAGIHSPNESVDPTEIEKIAAAEAAFLLSYGKCQLPHNKEH